MIRSACRPTYRPNARETYIDNYLAATRNTGRLMLFACDQKIEHLNDDFFGEDISADDNEPEHLFRIGSQGVVRHPRRPARSDRRSTRRTIPTSTTS